jgi:peptidoglycan hydrolase CwlO-like protein
MTNEEMRKAMQFIVAQQAQFSVDIQKIQESHARIQESHERLQDSHERFQESHERLQDSQQKLTESQTQTAELIGRLAAATHAGFNDFTERMNALVDAQMRTEESQRKTEESLKKTDESLRSLTAVVERHIREGHDGGT